MAPTKGLTSLRKIENLPGFVVNFLLAGPFNVDQKTSSCKAFDKDFLSLCGGETSVSPKAGQRIDGSDVRWKPHGIRHGMTANLRNEYAGQSIVVYASVYLDCPKSQTAQIRLGSDDGIKVWLNDALVWKNHTHRGLGIDNDIFEVKLKKGTNKLLLKIEQSFGAHEFCLRLADTAGNAIKGLRAYFDHPKVKNPCNPLKSRTTNAYEYLAYKYASASMKLTLKAKTSSQYKIWRKDFLSEYKNLLGPFPKKCLLKPEITEDIGVENFRRKKILLDLEPGFSIPCYLTLPKKIEKKQKLSAILCLHGHGDGKSEMLGLNLGTSDEKPWHEPGAIALHAARAGYVTISPDFLAFGERGGISSPFGEGVDPCLAQYSWGQTTGLIPTTLNIHAIRRCIDYLLTLPFIDKNRIAAVGHSHGGYITTMATAVEPRIKTAVISGFMQTHAGALGKSWECGSQVVPNLFNYGDLADLACTFTPRPLLLISGLYDSCAPAPFAFAAFKKIKKAYALAGCPEKAELFTFPGEHLFQPQAALEFLERYL